MSSSLEAQVLLISAVGSGPDIKIWTKHPSSVMNDIGTMDLTVATNSATRSTIVGSGLDWASVEDLKNILINLINDVSPFPLMHILSSIGTEKLHRYTGECDRLKTDIVIRQLRFTTKKFSTRSPYHWTVHYDLSLLIDPSCQLPLLEQSYYTLLANETASAAIGFPRTRLMKRRSLLKVIEAGRVA
ncbi:hypothetical protein AOQ84DRAFT_360976 [Glonium stellatum]|uniref:Uncharacterized protein n=1 Tax=Glonium stellatum TaxID=574774 RepID=A0A8E2F7N4_9PEZI|nr:hypothetical protein AOQ84DRAFT_360976 [Glonium stellatum]